MTMCNDSKNKVAFYFVLVSLLIRIGHQTEVNDLSWHLRSAPSTIEQMSTADKLDQIRQLGRSLLFNWNFGGESEVEGNKERESNLFSNTCRRSINDFKLRALNEFYASLFNI